MRRNRRIVIFSTWKNTPSKSTPYSSRNPFVMMCALYFELEESLVSLSQKIHWHRSARRFSKSSRELLIPDSLKTKSTLRTSCRFSRSLLREKLNLHIHGMRYRANEHNEKIPREETKGNTTMLPRNRVETHNCVRAQP